jgi:hypothetical protein
VHTIFTIYTSIVFLKDEHYPFHWECRTLFYGRLFYGRACPKYIVLLIALTFFNTQSCLVELEAHQGSTMKHCLGLGKRLHHSGILAALCLPPSMHTIDSKA